MNDVLRPRLLFDQNFGLGLFDEDVQFPQLNTMNLRSWRRMALRDSGVSNIQYENDGFRANIDEQQLKHEEILVKTVRNSVLIEGKYEERPEEHGFISREFQRRHTLPKDVDPNAITSRLTSDEILTIEAPRKALPQLEGERVVPITQMSLAPYIMNDFFGEWDVFRPRSLFDESFALGLFDQDMLFPNLNPMYLRQWRQMAPRDSGVSNIQYDKDGFRANTDVQQFKPEEIVKIVRNSVLVEKQHEEILNEHGFISREFQRRYTLPEDVDPNTITPTHTSNEILNTEAPRKALPQPEGERVFPIARVGASAATQVPN
ncbi:alpha-crystallin B chain-like [Anabrus simplex]|uniref:alpha-crystallin B chain-like n=1 Tax=Anabrus simplex TaxID=316456 RepID=UPI0035A2ABF5